MNSKVSMVMPCYNKEEDISMMFDSIIAQKWDKIEVVLVNDGSTDKTREVISEYIPKFQNRGYETIVIDQVNAGVSAAGKAGLEQVSGQYICLVDADDELDPNYVSTMATWLDEHPDCEFCMCEKQIFTLENGIKKFNRTDANYLVDNESNLTELFLTRQMNTTVWQFLVRKKYFDECKILENFYIDTKGSHEPCYVVPILSYAKKYKYFSDALYYFNMTGEGHSRSPELKKTMKYYEEYKFLLIHAINSLDKRISDEHKKQMLFLAEVFCYVILLFHFTNPNIEKKNNDNYERIIKNIISFFVRHGVLKDGLDYSSLLMANEMFYLIRRFNMIVSDRIMVNDLKFTSKDIMSKKIIAYGSKGKIARRVLPIIENTIFKPEEHWDQQGDGIEVKKPNFDLLSENNLLIVFPSKKEVIEEIKEILNGKGHVPTIFYSNNYIRTLLESYRFADVFSDEFNENGLKHVINYIN